MFLYSKLSREIEEIMQCIVAFMLQDNLNELKYIGQ
jgi:hypothetical protein